ncbi:hypothetical protein DMENIID0001_012820 [Sergentomyia squamirostris]
MYGKFVMETNKKVMVQFSNEYSHPQLEDLLNAECTAILDSIVEKAVLLEFSWTGVGRGIKKHPMSGLRHLQSFLQEVSSDENHQLQPSEVENFLKTKLKNARSGAKIQGLRTPGPHTVRRRKTYNNESDEDEEESEESEDADEDASSKI